MTAERHSSSKSSQPEFSRDVQPLFDFDDTGEIKIFDVMQQSAEDDILADLDPERAQPVQVTEQSLGAKALKAVGIEKLSLARVPESMNTAMYRVERHLDEQYDRQERSAISEVRGFDIVHVALEASIQEYDPTYVETRLAVEQLGMAEMTTGRLYSMSTEHRKLFSEHLYASMVRIRDTIGAIGEDGSAGGQEVYARYGDRDRTYFMKLRRSLRTLRSELENTDVPAAARKFLGVGQSEDRNHKSFSEKKADEKALAHVRARHASNEEIQVVFNGDETAVQIVSHDSKGKWKHN